MKKKPNRNPEKAVASNSTGGKLENSQGESNPFLASLTKYRVVLLSMAAGAVITNINDVAKAAKELKDLFNELRGPEWPQADIVIAPIRGQPAKLNVDFQQRIIARVAEENKLIEGEIIVKPLTTLITSEAEALEVLSKTHGTVVIWGWQDDLGVWLQTTTTALPAESDLHEIKMGAVDPEAAALNVTSAVESAAMLCNLAIAQYSFARNHYSLGKAYLERVVKQIPDGEKLVKNPELNYYLLGKRVKPDDMSSVRRRGEYFAKSLHASPNYVPSLNNLAKALGVEAKEFEPDLGYFGAQPSETDPAVVILAKLANQSTADVVAALSPEGDSPDNEKANVLGDPSLFLWDRAIALAPSQAILKYNRVAHRWLYSGAISDRKRFEDECRESLLEILKVDSSISGVPTLLGLIAANSNENAAAVEYFRNAIALSPSDPNLIFNLAQVESHTDPAAALADYSRALRLAPDHRRSRIGRSLIHAKAKQWPQAQRELSLVPIELDPSPGEDASLVLKAILAACTRNAVEIASARTALGRLQYVNADVELIAHWLFTPEKSLQESGIAGTDPFSYYSNYSGLSDYGRINYLDALAAKVGGLTDEEAKSQDSQDRHSRSVADALVRKRAADLQLSVPEYLLHEFALIFFGELEYRKVIEIGGLACPHVYAWDATAERWRFLSTILTHRSGPALSGTDVLPLNPAYREFLIQENEPEITLMDRVRVMNAKGVSSEFEKRKLRPGQLLRFTVPDPQTNGPAVLEASGYYQPLRESFARD